MYNGFQVHTKRAKMFDRPVTDSDGNRNYIREVKGNIEIEMVVEALSASALCDTIVLFSDSGELVSLVKALQFKGCRVIVASSEQTRDSTVAGELRRQADDFLDLETLRPHIEMAAQRSPERG
jgi:uncharacterized LabA/DUF88 family protein